MAILIRRREFIVTLGGAAVCPLAAVVDEIEEFLTDMRRGPESDRVLTTVLFTDIVDATRKAVELGDHQWRALLEQHHAVVREHLRRFRGREIDTARSLLRSDSTRCNLNAPLSTQWMLSGGSRLFPV
jgi:class 3 adenylate cyclase